jgi:multisubunit Na+/H+ antiporter MnhG subunit
MANAFRSLFGRDDNNTFIALSINHLKNSIKTDPAIPLLIISLGILLTASSGSWDITNHLLNRPETFFSPPHAGLYSGVVLVLFGSLMTYRYHRHSGKISDSKTKKSLPTYLRLVIVGIVMLISAGPLDFAWHTAFGLDGLLSPPHAVLTMGLVLCSIGAFLGLIRKNNYYGRMRTKTNIMTNDDNYSIVGLKNISRNDTTTRTKRSLLYIIIAITAIWITVSGIIHMVSLPFSDTDYFKFNPNPLLAGLIATLCFPFLVSFMLFTSWEITKKFGMLSASGMVFIFINLVTTILPNENLVPMIPFYLLNVIPIILIDVLLSLPALGISSPILLSQTRKKIVKMLAGIVLGLTFFMLYFPLITHTYNEVSINPQPVWPSVTASIYFEMIDEMFPLLVVSSMAAGILGVIVSSKLTALALHDIHGMTK